MWGKVHAIPRQERSLQSSAVGIYLLDVFESTKALVTMERAALFKKKNYGKLISDVSIVTESNHKRVMDILCSIFQDVLKRPTTEVSATRNKLSR